jgi:HK97 family phage portal protein
MSILDRFRRKKIETAAAEPEKRWTVDSAEAALYFAQARAASGVMVSAENVLTFSAVLACVRVLAESVASLPLITYRRLSDGGKERALNHPLYSVLHDSPNDDMTSMQWRETSMAHCVLWGNCYSEIVYDGGGRVRELWPLLPQFMRVERKNDAILYHYEEPGKRPIVYEAWQILHVPGLSMNGLIGMSMISIARDAIGLGLTLNEYGGRQFANGTRAGGVLESPGQLSEDAYKRLKESFQAEYGGAANAGKTVLLEEGVTFKPITMPNDDAQFLQSRKFQVEEVARIFRVPLHKINSLEHATFSNIEHQSIEFVTDTLRPWLVRWEQALAHKLISQRERGRVFSEHLVDGLLRGDTTSRYQAYAVGRQWGWFSINDILKMENMNPIEDGDGHLVPLNMSELGAEPPPAAAPPPSPVENQTPAEEPAPSSGNGTRHKVREVEDGH